MGLFDRLSGRLFGSGGSGGSPTVGRVSGPPTSSNRASSFHLIWQVPPQPLNRVEVTLEVVAPPQVDQLYFWALQVGFARSNGTRVGGAHLGLQFHPDHPGAGAINWGGYHDRGGELKGSISGLPSALNNVNTRDFAWIPERPYRLRVDRSPETGPEGIQGWRGSVVDQATGETTVVRDLWVDADHLVGPMVWSEVFAHCDHPPSTVRWSDPVAYTDRGEIRAQSVRLNYQSHGDGGCANTNTWIDETGWFAQTTNTDRVNPPGTLLTHSPK